MTVTEFKDGRWTGADWRPLGPQTEPRIVARKAIIAHTIVGGLRGAEAVFRPGGYDGTEAHFGIGGPWDGDGLDGAAWQWQDVRHQSDAQFAGNAIGVSVEHSDGGNPHRPFSTKQLRTDVALFADFLRTADLPARLMTSPTGEGVGYHELFPSWNTDAHSCPGPVREGQLRTIILPKVRARLLGIAEPVVVVKHDPSHTGKHDLEVDGILSHDTIAAMQSAVGFKGGDVDGIFGPLTRRALEEHLGTDVDGDIEPIDVKALQARLFFGRFYPDGLTRHDAIDGRWRRPDTRALQRALNAGRF